MAQLPERNQTRRAQGELRELILSGDLPAGKRLYEMAIASALDISRTPAREAMSRLVEEGLLERHRSGGFRVRSFSIDDVHDAIELRGTLEGLAARLAAERRPGEQDLDDLRATVQRLDECFGATVGEVDFETYTEVNAAFHAQLADASGSMIVRQELERVTSLPFASPSAFVGTGTASPHFLRSFYAAQEQHREIVSAIAAGEGMRAEMIAREHARAARRNLDSVVNDHGLRQRVPGIALIVD